jgi:CBS domain-containing protein
MRVADVMKSRPEYLRPYESSSAAARRMRDRNVALLPVCDGHRRVIGLITDRDIALRVVAEGLQHDLPVGDVMTRELVPCHPDDDLLHAERLMMVSHKSRIVVLDEVGRLVGVVSLCDIAEHDRDNAVGVIASVSGREIVRRRSGPVDQSLARTAP